MLISDCCSNVAEARDTVLKLLRRSIMARDIAPGRPDFSASARTAFMPASLTVKTTLYISVAHVS
jgi:hypothetical protein